MKRFTLVIAAVFAVTALITGAAEAKFEKMSDQSYHRWLGSEVGRFAYTGSVQEFMDANPCIKQEYKADHVATMEAASVKTSKWLELVNGLGLPPAEKQRLQALADKRGFLFLYHLEQAKVPAEIIALFGLKRTYEIEQIMDGQVCKCMPFTVNDVHKMRNVVYSGSPHDVLLFKTKTSTVRVDPRCNNGCFEPIELEKVYVPVEKPSVTESLERERRIAAIAAGQASEECPDGWAFDAYAYSYDLLPKEMQKKVDEAIAAAKKRDGRNATNPEPFGRGALSRDLGAELREVGVLASLDVDLSVSFWAKAMSPVKELGALHLKNGKGTFKLPSDPRLWIVVVEYPKTYFVSPVKSGSAPLLLAVFDWEWRGCSVYVTGIVKMQQ